LIVSQNPSDTQSLALRLRHGAADVAAVREEAARRAIKVELQLDVSQQVSGVQRTMRMEAWGLWALAALLGFGSVVILGQALVRMALTESVDDETLQALGASRSLLFATGMVRAAFVAVVGTVLAVGVAVVASALTPVGFARTAEPDPGIRIDTAVLFLGGALVFALVLLVSAPAVWIAA